MAFGRGPFSCVTRKQRGPLWNICARGFIKCFISDEMDGKKDEEVNGNADRDHESVRSECETEGINYKDTGAET
jgi:hypothetical protein